MNTAVSAATASPVAVRKTVVVAAPQDIAFEVFTARIESWWPMASHHIGQAECRTVVMEPHVGGRWFERGVDGSECDWGRVQVWEAPRRVVLVWQLSAAWAFDPALHTEIEVRFERIDAGSTRVELEHRGLEAYGSQAVAMQEILGSANGWTGMLEHYAKIASA